MIRRREFCISIASALTLPVNAIGADLPHMVVHKDPNCGCCGAWVDAMRAAGFTATVKENASIERVKRALGVPSELQSCHTAEIGGYVIEGHVPPDEVKRLLVSAPKAKGLSVPGMPIGSPGMEVPGANPDTYAVILFGTEAPATFARYTGSTRL